jgi:hypothetical protein
VNEWMTSIVVLINTGAGPGAPKIVNLAGLPPEPVTSAWPMVWMMLIAAGVALAVGGLMAYTWSRLDPVERAFCLLAFRLGMKRRDRALVRELAGRADVRPIALLISARAFGEALTRATRAGVQVDARVIERIRTRVFA